MPAWFRVYLAIWRRFMGGIMPSIAVSQCYLRIKFTGEMGEYSSRYDAAKDHVYGLGPRPRHRLDYHRWQRH